MAHAASFDDVFGPDSHSHTTGEPVRVSSWWSSWEAWLTLSLVLLAVIPVVQSLQTAEWVEEMPSLVEVGVAAVVVGWLLAQSRLHGAIGVVLGLGSGVAGVTLLVMRQVPITDPTVGDGLNARWVEFSLRMKDWFSALWEQSISADPLPFVVLLAALIYFVGFLSSWAVVRWQNAWVALIPGGIILLTNISYLPGQPSLSFKIFLLAAVLLVTRMEFLRAAKRWRLEHTALPTYMSIEVMFIACMVACVLVIAAWSVPTANNWGPVARLWDRALEPVSSRVASFGQLFVGVNAKRELPIHNFGSTLPLQGKVALSGTPLYHVTSTDAGNLRGASYDEYTGAGWKLTDASSAPITTSVQAAALGTQRTRAEVRGSVTTQVEVISPDAPDRRLLTVGDPLTANVAGRQIIDPTSQSVGVIPNASGKSYTSVGTISVAAVPTLQAAGTDYSQAIRDTYIALPSTVPPEVAALARQVAGNARTPYEAARRIESYLRRNYTYTLAPPPIAPRRDAVAAFLFDTRSGYFDHFASAMAVMMRSLGVPSRVATGFVLDPEDMDSATKTYSVSEQRAWAWPEVYFPNLGWVEFNPTPSRPVIGRPGDDSSALADADAARSAGDAVAAEEEPGDAPVLDNLDQNAANANDSFLTSRAGRITVQAISALLVLSVLALVAAVVVRVFWQRYFRGLSPAAARWAKLYRLAGWAGVSPPSHLTAVEAAESLGVSLGEVAAMRTIAAAYTRARYGPPIEDEREDEATRDAADRDYVRLRALLMRRMVSRFLHLGRLPEHLLPRGYATARAVR